MLLLACYYCTQKWREEEEERVILKHAQSLLPVDIFCYAEGPGIVAHHWASPREAVVSFAARDNAGLNCCVGIRPPVFTQHRRRACAPKKPRILGRLFGRPDQLPQPGVKCDLLAKCCKPCMRSENKRLFIGPPTVLHCWALALPTAPSWAKRWKASTQVWLTGTVIKWIML